STRLALRVLEERSMSTVQLRQADAEATSIRPPAPRVRVEQIGSRQTIGPASGETELDDFRTSFAAAMGTTESAIAEVLFEELLNIHHTAPTTPVGASTADLVLSFLHRIGPKDELEAMLTCQMIAAHVAIMDATRRALHVEQSPVGRATYLGLARKLMTA